MNSSFAQTLVDGLNEPKCAYWVGMFTGQTYTVKLIMILLAVGFLFKVVDKLAFDPFIAWIKSKLFKHPTEGGITK